MSRSLPIVVLLSAVSLTGCLRLQAKTVPAPPPLETPEAPERVVEVVDPAVLPIVSVPDEPPRPDAPPRPGPPARRAETRPADAKPAESPADANKPEEPGRPAAAVPPPTLQTTPAQQEGEVERRVRALIARATSDLSRTNFQALNADGRTQYDTARRFIFQADEALRAKNLVFATNLADKAAALAAQLAGR
jgi:hypothetical protein